MNKQNEAGFGLVEIMVAILLLGLIMTAAAPALVNSLRLTAANVNTAQAAKLANEQISLARLAASSCDTFKLNAERSVPNYTNSRGSEFIISIDSQILQPGMIDACISSDSPIATQWFEVTVVQSATHKELARVRTIVSVPGLK